MQQKYSEFLISPKTSFADDESKFYLRLKLTIRSKSFQNVNFGY